jgi:Tol biopolymer transport system component
MSPAGRATAVTNDPDLEFEPSWSPDDKRIAFNSTAPRPIQRLSRAADGSGRDERLIESKSPDSGLMAARINGLQRPTGEKLFLTNLAYANEKPYAVTHDGRRFLLPVASGPQPVPSTCVLVNWSAKLPK